VSGHLVGIDGDGIAIRPLADVAGKSRVLSREQISLLAPMTTAGY
jgi:hypothetical protein